MTNVVIISDAKNKELYQMTQEAVSSCFRTAYDITINVLEQANVKKYVNCDTWFIKEPFNYNRYANIGASLSDAETICIANNDVVFYPGWLSELLMADYPLVSPKCPNDARQNDLFENTVGEKVGRHFTGWCFLISTNLWKRIGGFDEDFGFWCADNAVIEQTKKVGILPMVVPSAKVVHLRSITLSTVNNREELTKTQVMKYDKKYNKNLYNELYKNRPDKSDHKKAGI